MPNILKVCLAIDPGSKSTGCALLDCSTGEVNGLWSVRTIGRPETMQRIRQIARTVAVLAEPDFVVLEMPQMQFGKASALIPLSLVAGAIVGAFGIAVPVIDVKPSKWTGGVSKEIRILSAITRAGVEKDIVHDAADALALGYWFLDQPHETKQAMLDQAELPALKVKEYAAGHAK